MCFNEFKFLKTPSPPDRENHIEFIKQHSTYLDFLQLKPRPISLHDITMSTWDLCLPISYAWAEMTFMNLSDIQHLNYLTNQH